MAVGDNKNPVKPKEKPIPGDTNNDGVLSPKEVEALNANNATSETVGYSNFPEGAFINVPGFGKAKASDAPYGTPAYVSAQMPKTYDTYKGGTSSQVKGLFTVLASKNDPRLLEWMATYGIDNYADARKLWDKAVDYAADIAYTGKSVNLFKIMSSGSFLSENMKLFTGGSGGGASGPTTMRYVSLTNETLARQNLQRDMKNLLGREATDKELSEYVKKLHSAQTKLAAKTRYSDTEQASVGSGFDEEAFTLQYILNKAGGKFDGGTLKATMDSVKTLAAQYGITAANTPTKYKQLTKQLVMGETTTEAIAAQFSKTAASLFPVWAEFINQKPSESLAQIASDYTNVYANMMEIDPDQVDLVDVLNKATVDNNGQKTVGSLSDLQRALRKDARYQFTTNAKREAAAFGASFARSMGVNL